METEYLYPAELSAFRGGIIDIMRDGRFPLVDANINSREIRGAITSKEIYTVTGVDMEAGSKWDNAQLQDSYSVNDIKDNSGTMSLTASIGEKPEESTVCYSPLSNAVSCGCCGAPARGILSSAYGSACACQNLSKNDQKLLVETVAFPWLFILVTNEGCLGWSSMFLNSYCLQKRKYWRYYFEELYAARKLEGKY